MKIIIIKSSLLILLIGLSTLANCQKLAIIEGYQFNNKQIEKKGVVTKVTSKQINEVKEVESQNDKIAINNLVKPSSDTLFYESFNSKTLDNIWVENSGTDNMIGVFDSVYGKVLKISCKQPNGSSFIEYDLTDIARGKMLKLEGDIKLENIKRGKQAFEIGQLAIKFQVGDKWVYVAAQNLVGSSDWKTYSAHEDGSTNIDNTDKGSHVFKIPNNAENVTLYLGLQNCTGSIYFKNIRIIKDYDI